MTPPKNLDQQTLALIEKNKRAALKRKREKEIERQSNINGQSSSSIPSIPKSPRKFAQARQNRKPDYSAQKLSQQAKINQANQNSSSSSNFGNSNKNKKFCAVCSHNITLLRHDFLQTNVIYVKPNDLFNDRQKFPYLRTYIIVNKFIYYTSSKNSSINLMT